MRLRVLGAAAGGGFPQWNCHCANCARARAGDPLARPRTQASIAVSADGLRWVLFNASPDLPSQLRDAACLHPDPARGPRHSPLAAVVISGGDIDCIAGLLSLREGHKFVVYAADFVGDILAQSQVFGVLNPDIVRRETLPSAGGIWLHDAAGAALGLRVEAFAVLGKIPLYQEAGHAAGEFTHERAVSGLEITDTDGGSVLFIPGCAAVTEDIRARAQRSQIMFFDGTLWHDREMIEAGLSQKTGARMGHISISGADGSLAVFANTPIARKVFIHINNTNPILCEDSPQASAVRQAGWEIAYDGMEMSL